MPMTTASTKVITTPGRTTRSGSTAAARPSNPPTCITRHRAAADMCRRAGDSAGAARHDAQAKKIHTALDQSPLAARSRPLRFLPRTRRQAPRESERMGLCPARPDRGRHDHARAGMESDVLHRVGHGAHQAPLWRRNAPYLEFRARPVVDPRALSWRQFRDGARLFPRRPGRRRLGNPARHDVAGDVWRPRTEERLQQRKRHLQPREHHLARRPQPAELRHRLQRHFLIVRPHAGRRACSATVRTIRTRSSASSRRFRPLGTARS